MQSAGGYRAYYKDPSRGTMQGGNVPGGLGLDKEFFESILVPQVMLYGFLGLRPTADGCAIAPRLPSDWKELIDHADSPARPRARHARHGRRHRGERPHAGRTPLVIEVPPSRKLKIVSALVAGDK